MATSLVDEIQQLEHINQLAAGKATKTISNLQHINQQRTV
jgi:hypothetical protein